MININVIKVSVILSVLYLEVFLYINSENVPVSKKTSTIHRCSLMEVPLYYIIFFRRNKFILLWYMNVIILKIPGNRGFTQLCVSNLYVC